MYRVYVLYSPDFNKLYIGFTSDLEARLRSHNELGNKDWMTRYRPWTLAHSETFDTKAEAMKREKQLKGGQGSIWLRQML
jgi:putative endonuclease